MDETGGIVGCNRHWRRFAIDNGLPDTKFGIGTNYIALCEAVVGGAEEIDAAQTMASGLRAILTGTTESVRVEYPCHSPTEWRWFIALAVPLTGRRERAAALHIEITDRREAEEALRKARDELELRVADRTRALRHEIAQRVQAEVALRASEERYRTIVEDQTELVCRFLPDTTLIFANPACAAFLGGTTQSVISRKILDLIPEDQRPELLAHLAELSPQAPVARREWHSGGPDGRRRWHIWTTRAFFDAAGSPVEFQGVGTDITELKRTEMALTRATAEAEAASRTKSQFLAAVSHDLRQPLQTIGILRSILSKTIADPDAKRHLRALGAAHRSMSMLLDTMLDINQLAIGMAQPKSADFPAADLMDLLADEFAPVARAKGLDLRIVRSSVILRSNLGFLSQLMHNLLANAVRYTKSGRILVGCRRRDGKARLEIRDTGIGIPAGQIERIFDEFHQVEKRAGRRNDGLRSKGFGLGLAIAKRIADLLGYPITVHSTLGKGSLFAIEVPLGHVERVSPGIAAATHAPERQNPDLILLIEDDAAVLDALVTLLRLEGFRIMAAANSAEALDRIAGADETPAAIIADYRLPGDESGIEAIRRIQERTGSELPGIILTGEFVGASREDIERTGFPVLRKPSMPEELFAAIHRALGRSP